MSKWDYLHFSTSYNGRDCCANFGFGIRQITELYNPLAPWRAYIEIWLGQALAFLRDSLKVSFLVVSFLKANEWHIFLCL